MPFRPGLDSNNNARFKAEGEQDRDSPLLKQREDDKSLVRKLLTSPDHALIRLLRRNAKNVALPSGTTTTEFALVKLGMDALIDSLVEILEEPEDA